MTTQHAPGNPYVKDPDEILSDSEWGVDPDSVVTTQAPDSTS